MSTRRHPITSRRSSGGFTLVELLVVIGIIALLISILLPALNKARAAAVTVQCLARMRELGNAAYLYATNNRQTLPPLAQSADLNYVRFSRPAIFPTTSDPLNSCYLSKYMGAGDTAERYVCPTFADSTGYNTNGNQSYRYNRYLGGMPSNWWSLRTLVNGHRFFEPYKLSQIRHSSNYALFMDAGSVTSGYGNGGNGIWFRNEPGAETGAFASPRSYHMFAATGGMLLHNRRLTGSTYGAGFPAFNGYLNLAFTDGSARSVFVTIDRSPIRPIDGVFVRPERPTPGW
jgi:prepilin-type N-terminal cleavage/methylation domain-containing protein